MKKKLLIFFLLIKGLLMQSFIIVCQRVLEISVRIHKQTDNVQFIDLHRNSESHGGWW